MTASEGAALRWQRLGDMLIQRRTALDSRWHNRTAFCEATGLSYRLVYDIEEGRRTNFGGSTKAAIEAAYHLAPGAVDRYIQGGDLYEGATVTRLPFTGPSPMPGLADLPEILRKLPPDIEEWIADVDADIASGRMPRNQFEASVWDNPGFTPDRKRLMLGIARSELAAAARGERRGEGRAGGNRTG